MDAAPDVVDQRHDTIGAVLQNSRQFPPVRVLVRNGFGFIYGTFDRGNAGGRRV